MLPPARRPPALGQRGAFKRAPRSEGRAARAPQRHADSGGVQTPSLKPGAGTHARPPFLRPYFLQARAPPQHDWPGPPHATQVPAEQVRERRLQSSSDEHAPRAFWPAAFCSLGDASRPMLGAGGGAGRHSGNSRAGVRRTSRPSSHLPPARRAGKGGGHGRGAIWIGGKGWGLGREPQQLLAAAAAPAASAARARHALRPRLRGRAAPAGDRAPHMRAARCSPTPVGPARAPAQAGWPSAPHAVHIGAWPVEPALRHARLASPQGSLVRQHGSLSAPQPSTSRSLDAWSASARPKAEPSAAAGRGAAADRATTSSATRAGAGRPIAVWKGGWRRRF
jgi:hypothetical protein